jgi:hypothetical protein
MGLTITALKPDVQVTDGIRVELFTQYLLPFGRKLYVVDPGKTLCIPDDRAHAHPTVDRLAPIAGNVVLAYQTPRGAVEYLKLIPGLLYIIPPHVPHQIQVNGGILESFSPSAAYLNGKTIWELAGGFFERRE